MSSSGKLAPMVLGVPSLCPLFKQNTIIKTKLLSESRREALNLEMTRYFTVSPWCVAYRMHNKYLFEEEDVG